MLELQLFEVGSLAHFDEFPSSKQFLFLKVIQPALLAQHDSRAFFSVELNQLEDSFTIKAFSRVLFQYPIRHLKPSDTYRILIFADKTISIQ